MRAVVSSSPLTPKMSRAGVAGDSVRRLLRLRRDGPRYGRRGRPPCDPGSGFGGFDDVDQFRLGQRRFGLLRERGVVDGAEECVSERLIYMARKRPFLGMTSSSES